MDEASDSPRALAGLVVPSVGRLREAGDGWELLDPAGERVAAAEVFFRDLLASGRAESTVRSYGMDLLRWFRFLWTVEVSWDW